MNSTRRRTNTGGGSSGLVVGGATDPLASTLIRSDHHNNNNNNNIISTSSSDNAWSDDDVELFDSDDNDNDVDDDNINNDCTNDVELGQDGVDDDDDDDTGALVSLRIQATHRPNTPVEIQVEPTLPVSQLKHHVQQALGPAAEGRYLRLIAKGRLLAPDTAALKDFSVANGDVLHAVLAAAGVRGGQQAALARGTTRRYRGTGVSSNGRIDASRDTEAHNNNDDWGESSDEEDGRERLGFDRLRLSGLSRQEITAIRTYFSRQVDRWLAQQPPNHPYEFLEENDVLRRRHRQEDAWMQQQGPASEFRLNLNQNTSQMLRFTNNTTTTTTTTMTNNTTTNNALFRASVGTDKDFMWGFLLGFFVGFLMLVWVWMPTVPHKQKLGILTGISLQLALSLLKGATPDEEDSLLDEGV